MPTTNQINSEFQEIAITAADGALLGVNVGQLQVSSAANITIPGGTSGQVLAATGTGTLQWASTPNNVIGEYGEASVPTNIAVPPSNVTPQTVDVISFTLPSAGVWEVTYSLRGSVGTLAAFLVAFVADNSNANVANSSSLCEFLNSPGASVSTQYAGTATQTVRITTTGSAIYKLRARTSGDTTSTNGVFGFVDGNGGTKVVWKKISGFIPVTGETTSYSSATVSTTLVGGGNIGQDVSFVTNAVGTIPLSGSGVWTLTAGVTYQIFAAATYDAGSTNQFTGDTFGEFVDAITNTRLPNQFGSAVITPFFTGRGISRNSTDVFTYTPSTNQTIKFRVTFQNSAGNYVVQTYINQLGTTNTAGFTGNMGNAWSIANSYQSGTVVVKDGFLYQANSFIAAGTTFVTGTTSGTWALMNVQQAEWGEAPVPNNVPIPISNVTPQTVDVITFTLPSAGVWEVIYNVRCSSPNKASYVTIFLADGATNTMVPNSNELAIFINGTALPAAMDYQGISSMVTRITTSGQAVYKLRATASGGTSPAQIQGFVDPNGGSKVTWKKISGFLPLQPQTYTSPTVIQGTTSNPSKGTTVIDYVAVTDDGSGWCDLVLSYRQTTAGTFGSGDYLFVLPGGLEFDLSYYQPRAVVGDPLQEMGCFIPGANGMLSVPNLIMNAFATVWDGTRFRLNMGAEALYSSNTNVRLAVSSTFFALNSAPVTYQMAFRFRRQL